MAATVSHHGILNPTVGLSCFSLARHEPSPDLAFFVERYWVVRWDLRGREPYLSETLPHPCVNVVVEDERAAVHGVVTKRFAILLEGEGQAFGIKLRPGAFHPFVQRPLVELTDRVVPLADVFGPAADTLIADVRARRGDVPAQIARVEAFLRERLPAADPSVDEVVRIVQLVLESRELTRVEQLAERTGCSVRAMQRLFRRYVGVSPKWVIRRLRLHEAADRVARGELVSWTDLALSLGYCDQAHFIRDFRAQVGHTPTAYAARCAAQRSTLRRRRAPRAPRPPPSATSR